MMNDMNMNTGTCLPDSGHYGAFFSPSFPPFLFILSLLASFSLSPSSASFVMMVLRVQELCLILIYLIVHKIGERYSMLLYLTLNGLPQDDQCLDTAYNHHKFRVIETDVLSPPSSFTL